MACAKIKQQGIAILLYMSSFILSASHDMGTKNNIESPTIPVIRYVVTSMMSASAVSIVTEQFVSKM